MTLTPRPTAQQCILALEEAGYTPTMISALLDERVSPRTIYRWGKGETAPQNEADMTILVDRTSAITGKGEGDLAMLTGSTVTTADVDN